MKTCITHHHACDCREEKFRQLEKENEQLKADKDYKRFESLLLQNNNLTKENLQLKAERDALKKEYLDLINWAIEVDHHYLDDSSVCPYSKRLEDMFSKSNWQPQE